MLPRGVRERAVLILVAWLAAACSGAGRGQEGLPNILFLTVESLRPDHVGFHAGDRPTTPNLDALAAESMVYLNAHAVTSWTLTSHASLFTGLYPTAHQTVRPLDKLGDSYLTLAELLAEHGYQTAGAVSGPYLRRAHNLHQGFELYDDSLSGETHVGAHDDVTNPELLAALKRFLREERDPRRPFFLFGYFWDPHYDYIPPAPYDSTFVGPDDVPVDMSGYGRFNKVHAASPPGEMAYVLSQYDGEILWTDTTLGELFEVLRQEGLWDDTVIVVTSDHGEEFFEHGAKGHKNNLFVESVHVPLLIKHRGGHPRGRDSRLVSLVDLLPTILDLIGASTELPLHGRSLLESDPPGDRSIFYELQSMWYFTPPGGEEQTRVQSWIGIRRGDFKLVGVPETRMYLFNVRDDPREQVDLLRSGSDPDGRAPALSAHLDVFRRDMEATRRLFEAGGPAKLSAEELERLRFLGYLK
jgi:arylsulfatase A-like enzyme